MKYYLKLSSGEKVEVKVLNEFTYEGKTYVTVVPAEFNSIEREVLKSSLIEE